MVNSFLKLSYEKRGLGLLAATELPRELLSRDSFPLQLSKHLALIQVALYTSKTGVRQCRHPRDVSFASRLLLRFQRKASKIRWYVAGSESLQAAPGRAMCKWMMNEDEGAMETPRNWNYLPRDSVGCEQSQPKKVTMSAVTDKGYRSWVT
jgi:hypothetical protein